MEFWVGVIERINEVLQANQSEKRNFKEVHWDVELQHVRGKDDVGVVENDYDEDPGRENEG